MHCYGYSNATAACREREAWFTNEQMMPGDRVHMLRMMRNKFFTFFGKDLAI